MTTTRYTILKIRITSAGRFARSYAEAHRRSRIDWMTPVYLGRILARRYFTKESSRVIEVTLQTLEVLPRRWQGNYWTHSRQKWERKSTPCFRKARWSSVRG